jgi:hypothetical protein
VSSSVELTPGAIEDLDNIWWFIANDNREAADRVETEIVATCRKLAKPSARDFARQTGHQARPGRPALSAPTADDQCGRRPRVNSMTKELNTSRGILSFSGTVT